MRQDYCVKRGPIAALMRRNKVMRPMLLPWAERQAGTNQRRVVGNPGCHPETMSRIPGQPD